MKKLIVLIVTVLTISVPSHAYWVRVYLWNTEGLSKQESYNYQPKTATIFMTLLAYRGGDFVYSAPHAFASFTDKNGNDFYTVSVSAQQPGENQYYERTFHFTRVVYNLYIQLYCPLLYDYAAVRANW